MVKTIKGPIVTVGDGPSEQSQKEAEFKLYDFNYYEDEVDLFEEFYLGELTFGEFKMKREFVETDDRMATFNW